ncbi:MAG: cysteine desulfurase family protein [Gemmataceae bacterium]|nr:cysteine desulfurase [Gemmata sp.]MDW8198267.1 cysteine desulfurase family protein [Gemmataceae bacterium]
MASQRSTLGEPYNAGMQVIYLDHNATTPLLPQAWAAMQPLMVDIFGNPSSAHAWGRAARRALDDAREQIAALLGAEPDEVTFTSGATEANNLAIFGLAGTPRPFSTAISESQRVPVSASRPSPSVAPEGGKSDGDTRAGQLRVFTSPIEHPCVVEPVKQLEGAGVPVVWLPVDRRGIVQTDGLTAQRGDLVCVMLANHETGAVQPVREMVSALPPGVRFHCDAVQAVGKIPVNFRELGVATLSVSAHKFGGPKGIGALLVRRGVELQPQTWGGHQQKGRRPGTEPVALAVGMAVALDHTLRHREDQRAQLELLRERLWAGLQQRCAPVVLNGPPVGACDVVPTTLNVSFPGCRADVLLMALDLAGVACSTGSACSSGSLLPSPVLRAMNIPDDLLRSAIRFSLSPRQTPAEIDDAVERIAACVQRIRRAL